MTLCVSAGFARLGKGAGFVLLGNGVGRKRVCCVLGGVDKATKDIEDKGTIFRGEESEKALGFLVFSDFWRER